MRTIRSDKRLFPYPSAWYCIDDVRGLAPGELRHFSLCGEDIVYFRTEGGTVAAMEAHCPHMGAHFAHGGAVVGEHVQCPFHGYEFGVDGRCARVPESKGVPKLQARTLHTDVVMDHLFVWYDFEGRAPTFRLELWDKPLVSTISRAVTMHTHPQELAENGADLRHFRFLHHNNFRMERAEVDPTRPQVFRTRLKGKIYEQSSGRQFQRDLLAAEVDIAMNGLGFLAARCDLHNVGVVNQYLACGTPLNEHETVLRIITAFEEIDDFGSFVPGFRRLPGSGWLQSKLQRPVAELFTKLMFEDVVKVQLEDRDVWHHKVHRSERRGLDRPVVKFREWAEQFYPRADPYLSLEAATDALDLVPLRRVRATA
jgi:phenylpropionate dioxygenase-like ring-hydroxylating dioxygenase large terminal subunit